MHTEICNLVNYYWQLVKYCSHTLSCDEVAKLAEDQSLDVDDNYKAGMVNDSPLTDWRSDGARDASR